MDRNEIMNRRKLFHEEILHRWPSLSTSALNSAIAVPDDLNVLLRKHFGFSEQKAHNEAQHFWDDLEERLRRAA